MAAYYNEIDPFAAQWLRNLIKRGLIADGEVDQQSIKDVNPDDLKKFTQCHFFAGIGGWAYSARLAGWPDDCPLWTGSCPCQPFSNAGKREGFDDERHLWPDFFRLISAARPPVIVGEQVAAKAGYGWFDGVRTDMARESYACRGVDVPACAVDAPHIRQRLYWVAVADSEVGHGGAGFCQGAEIGHGLEPSDGYGRDGILAHDFRDGWRPDEPGGAIGRGNSSGWDDARDFAMVNNPRDGWGQGEPQSSIQRGWPTASSTTSSDGLNDGVTLGDAIRPRLEGLGGHEYNGAGWAQPYRPIATPNGSFWADAEWIRCHDDKARRAQSGVPLLAHGIPNRVGKWRGFGNAIVPQLGAEVLRALMDVGLMPDFEAF